MPDLLPLSRLREAAEKARDGELVEYEVALHRLLDPPTVLALLGVIEEADDLLGRARALLSCVDGEDDEDKADLADLMAKTDAWLDRVEEL